MNQPDPTETARRDRYAAAVRQQAETGNVRYEAIADGVMAVADAEQAELRARLADDLRYLLDHREPGHAHQRPGVWDGSGLPCGHCARLAAAREAVIRYTGTGPGTAAGILPLLDGLEVAAGDAARRECVGEQPENETPEAPYPTTSEYAIQAYEAAGWGSVTFRRQTLAEAQERRNSYRNRFPATPMRIVRWDETSTVVESDEVPGPPAVVPQPEEADRIVAYSPGGRTLRCLVCAPPPWGDIWTPVTAGELEDGGICSVCGADVLIPPTGEQQ